MFGAGDRHQLITATGTENTSLQDGKTIKHPIQAIRGKPLMERVDRNTEMQLLLNRETNRFGEPLLGYLKKIFPDWEDVTTKVLHGTDWFPIFIDHNVNLAEARKSCPKKEISRESSMFVSVLTMLGLECVVNNAIADREILVICYLNLVVLDLEAFLKLYLEPMCELWHELIFGKNRDVNYQYWRLKESIKLQILGPMNARGKTADVVFTVGMQRQKGDADFKGMWADIKLLQIHFTRVRRRLYTFFHDMTEGIMLHQTAQDDVNTKALAAGVPESKRAAGTSTAQNKRAQHANIRKQTFFWTLKSEHCRRIWERDYQCRMQPVGSKNAQRHNYFTFLKDALPFQRSVIYENLINGDLQDITHRREMKNYIGTKGWVEQPLRQAVRWYEEMTNANDPKYGWPYPSEPLLDFTQQDLESPAFWLKKLQEDKQCREEMVPDQRHDNGMRSFRTTAQRHDESDDENEDAPDEADLFEQWKHLMFQSVTISVDSSERCIICVPFLKIHNATVMPIYQKSGRDAAKLPAATWLARALAEHTDALFTQFGACFFFGVYRFSPQRRRLLSYSSLGRTFSFDCD